MRVVGNQDRTEFILDPAEAWRRGRVLDGMLASAAPPRARAVLRATHAELNRRDDLRSAEIARRLNRAG
jgi:hypothetical protein